MSDPLHVALLQSRAPADIREAHEMLASQIRSAANDGAEIVVTQELCTIPYFCRSQDPRHFDLAEPIPGPTTSLLQDLASELEVVIVASLFEKRSSRLYHNTACVIDADGSMAGIYRKSHIPQDPGFEEKFYFAPGDTGFRSFATRYGRLGVIICWDQWFPEAARLTALADADLILCPTAIGWLAEEKDTLGDAQLHAWQTVQQGHAVANTCFYAAVNRVGSEGPIEFWGRSFVADFYGRKIAEADGTEGTVHAVCDLSALEEHRRMWPFFRDRRPDLYQGLCRLSPP